MSNPLSRIAIVTGAAGGIGRVLTRRLIEGHFHVVMLDIDDAGLADCQRAFGDEVTTLRCDVTDPASVAEAAAATQARFPCVHAIVNNAGCIVPGPFRRASSGAIERQMEINLLGPIRVLAAFLPQVSTGGSIVNVVSMAGILPLKNSAIYSAGKFGLRGLTLALALEMRERGIAVSGVYPSSVDTKMLLAEARAGGSPLNFLAEPLAPETVVKGIMRAIREGGLEYYAPYGDGFLSRLCAFFPWILPRLLPAFERQGAARMRRYLAKHQSSPECRRCEWPVPSRRDGRHPTGPDRATGTHSDGSRGYRPILSGIRQCCCTHLHGIDAVRHGNGLLRPSASDASRPIASSAYTSRPPSHVGIERHGNPAGPNQGRRFTGEPKGKHSVVRSIATSAPGCVHGCQNRRRF
ncbi:MAG: SDR family NAD(P)-dependent oxidoreductase [Methylorubrum populi]